MSELDNGVHYKNIVVPASRVFGRVDDRRPKMLGAEHDARHLRYRRTNAVTTGWERGVAKDAW